MSYWSDVCRRVCGIMYRDDRGIAAGKSQDDMVGRYEIAGGNCSLKTQDTAEFRLCIVSDVCQAPVWKNSGVL